MGSPAPVLPHPNSRPPTQPQQDYRHVQLFEPDREVPPNSLMQHYIQVFIENLGHEYPFLTYDQLIHDAWEGRMPAPLANVIAAMASRSVSLFTNKPSVDSSLYLSDSLPYLSLPFVVFIMLQKHTRRPQRYVHSGIAIASVAEMLCRVPLTPLFMFVPWTCCTLACFWPG